ncbi:MAG: hypothetical protein ABSH20_00925 [Tepidisphaeraceae bacterium]
MCSIILWAFWGLLQLADGGNDGSRLIWTAPDQEVAAMLTNLSWDDDTPECPKPAR